MGKRINSAVWDEKKKYWKINVQRDGKRRSFYSSKPGRTGQREANAKADAWLDEGQIDSNIRVKQIYPLFLESIVSNEEKRRAEQYGRLYILPAVGNKKISSLTDDRFQTILEKAAVSGVSGKPLSKKTLTSLLGFIKNFAKFCRRKKLTTLTLEFLSVPKGAKKGRKNILQPNDLSILFSTNTTILFGKRVKDEYIYCYRFMVLTGLRPGELIGLEKTDIIGNTVHLQRSINQDKELTTGKNENAQRSFVLSELAKKVLEDQLAVSKGKKVFPIQSQSTLRHRWEKYCESNGIPYISPYELRHTFVSMAKSLPEGQVKAIVGHSQNMDTFGIYGHEMQGEMAKTAENLDAIFSEIIQTKRKLHRPKFYKNASDSSEKVWCNPWCKPLYKKKNPHSNAGLSGGGGGN
jgi:integrase|nr:MAG TPA: Integrase [Bacteriophage sp.]